MEMPPINQRILKLIEHYASNNVAVFSKNILIPERSITRLFTAHKITKKYPIPSTQILISITINYPEVNANWLLTGKGEMSLKSLFNRIYDLSVNPINSLIDAKDNTIKEQAIEIGRLTERIRLMQQKMK